MLHRRLHHSSAEVGVDCLPHLPHLLRLHRHLQTAVAAAQAAVVAQEVA